MPALGNARFGQVKLDRQIAALRTVEAIRLYAGAAGGRLPARLEEVQQVPVPLNPMTGEPFTYELQADRAVLSAPLESDDRRMPEKAVRYEIQIAK
jgi:hypothetical protein